MILVLFAMAAYLGGGESEAGGAGRISVRRRPGGALIRTRVRNEPRAKRSIVLELSACKV